MDTSNESRASDLPESMAALKRRLRALQEVRDHYTELEAKATAAFEAHRVELTQLRQKERAMFMSQEDRVRAELHAVLAANRALMEKADAHRAEREAKLRGEFLASRRSHMDEMSTLQAELDDLWNQRRTLDGAVLRAVVEKEEEERHLLLTIDLQRQLHERLQHLKETILAAEEERMEREMRMRREDGSGRATNMTSRASPRRRRCGCNRPSARPTRVFIPSGPKGPLPDAGVDGGGSNRNTGNCNHCGHGSTPHTYDSDSTSAAWPCASSPSSLSHSPHRSHSWRAVRHASPPATTGPSAPVSTHNAIAILSTIERQNYLKPRDFLARRTEATAAVASAYEGEQEQEECSPLVERLAGMQLQCEARKASPVGGQRPQSPPLRPHSPYDPPSAPPPVSRRTPGVVTNPSLSPSGRPTPTPKPAAAPANTAMTAATSSSGSTMNTTAPLPRCSGRALNAVCDAIVGELQSLRDDYAACQRRLRDPACSSVEASREMRRLLAAMDRKADQLRAMRSQQRQQAERLHAKDVLAEVMRENECCARIYDDIVNLVRS